LSILNPRTCRHNTTIPQCNCTVYPERGSAALLTSASTNEMSGWSARKVYKSKGSALTPLSTGSDFLHHLESPEFNRLKHSPHSSKIPAQPCSSPDPFYQTSTCSGIQSYRCRDGYTHPSTIHWKSSYQELESDIGTLLQHFPRVYIA
jgi:hypothetical protein